MVIHGETDHATFQPRNCYQRVSFYARVGLKSRHIRDMKKGARILDQGIRSSASRIAHVLYVKSKKEYDQVFVEAINK